MKILLTKSYYLGSILREPGFDITDLPPVERECLLNLGVATHCPADEYETMVSLIREEAKLAADEARAREVADMEAAMQAATIQPDTSDQVEPEPEPEENDPVARIPVAVPEPEDEDGPDEAPADTSPEDEESP